jgi:hypothetical protein
LDLVELNLLANMNNSTNESHTFAVLSSHGCSVMFIADVWRTSSPASMASAELIGTGVELPLVILLENTASVVRVEWVQADRCN